MAAARHHFDRWLFNGSADGTKLKTIPNRAPACLASSACLTARETAARNGTCSMEQRVQSALACGIRGTAASLNTSHNPFPTRRGEAACAAESPRAASPA